MVQILLAQNNRDFPVPPIVAVGKRVTPLPPPARPIASQQHQTLALPKEVEHWSLTTLREKLVKIGAKVVGPRD